MLYAYAILCTCCYAAYLGASPIWILPIGALLALPNVAKFNSGRKFEAFAHALSGLIFAAIAHAIGRGIAFALAT